MGSPKSIAYMPPSNLPGLWGAHPPPRVGSGAKGCNGQPGAGLLVGPPAVPHWVQTCIILPLLLSWLPTTCWQQKAKLRLSTGFEVQASTRGRAEDPATKAWCHGCWLATMRFGGCNQIVTTTRCLSLVHLSGKPYLSWHCCRRRTQLKIQPA